MISKDPYQPRSKSKKKKCKHLLKHNLLRDQTSPQLNNDIIWHQSHLLTRQYLLFSKIDPEPSDGSLIRVSRQQRVLWPHLFNIFKDNHGLANRFSAMNKHRDLLVDWIVLQKQGTFVGKIFFYIFIRYSLQFQSPYHSVTKWTWPCPMQLHLTHV